MSDETWVRWDKLNREVWEHNFGRRISENEYREAIDFTEITEHILYRIHENHPHLRFGQILANAVGHDLFYISNTDMAQRLKEHEAWLDLQKEQK